MNGYKFIFITLLLAGCDAFNQPIKEIGKSQAEIEEMRNTPKMVCTNIRYRIGLVWYSRSTKTWSELSRSDIFSYVPNNANDYMYDQWRCHK